MVFSRDVEMGIAVEAQPESFLDARVQGGGKIHRLIVWKHDLPLSFLDQIGVSLPPNIGHLIFVVLMGVACVLTLVTQASSWLGWELLACQLCCATDQRGGGGGDRGGGGKEKKDCTTIQCSVEATREADACVYTKSILRYPPPPPGIYTFTNPPTHPLINQSIHPPTHPPIGM